MATLGWFLAAARTIEGPPMSICSTHSSGEAPDATVCGEGVEVGDDEVEGLDLELRELPDVGLEAAVGQDAGVDAGVQRLDAAVEALGEAGEVLDAGDGQAEAGDQGGRAAGGDELDTGVVQAADQLVEAGLVVDRDEGAAHGDLVVGECGVGHGGLLRSSGGGEHPGGRCSARSLPGGRPPAPVVWAQSSGTRRRQPSRTRRPSSSQPSRAIRPDRVDQHASARRP